MARYTGPRTRIARKFGEAIFGADKVLSKKNYPPGQHGNSRKRKTSEYGIQLREKQKAKYTYGVLEKQFRNLFEKASRSKGITGEVLLQLLEGRLDNVVFRLGIAPTRAAARQLVSHKHITVDGEVVNIPSFAVKPGQLIGVRGEDTCYILKHFLHLICLLDHQITDLCNLVFLLLHQFIHIKPVALIRRYSSCRCMWLNDISHVCQIRHLVPDCC